MYNGKEPLPEHSTWKLSDSYMVEQENPALELKVEVYNINYNETSELLQKSTYLNEYSYFIYLVQQYVQDGNTLEDAIKLASEQCIAENVMVDFLREHSMEVEEMLATEWDWDECIKVERKEGYEDGRAEERKEMIRMFSKINTPEQIAETLHVAKEYVLDVLKDDGTMYACEPEHPYNNK